MKALALSPAASARCRPGLRHGPNPRRRDASGAPTALDALLRRAFRPGRRRPASEARWLESLAARIAALETLTSARLARTRAGLKETVRRRGHDESTLVEALAHGCLSARRELGLVPHDAQRRAARLLLENRFVEMQTGEGKTLTLALAAAVASFDGTPVHVMTANDYLAERDARRLAPFYASLGVRAACVLPDMDEAARRAAYRADVVHVTGKQVAFDWLRDGVAGRRDDSLAARLAPLCATDGEDAGAPVLRGLCLALVDEADSLLVDEARTPLVLAAPSAGEDPRESESVVALGLARLLDEEADFRLESAPRRVTLSADGEARLARLSTNFAGMWRVARYRDERVRQALAVLHLWRVDRDYTVREGRVELVDEQSGRTLPDRRLQQGLHRLLERKEGCAPTPENETVASLSFQRFFLGYLRLGGSSGTLVEAAAELSRVYGASVHRVAPARTSIRRTLAARAFSSREAQLDFLVSETERCRALGRPVLIGTRSVEQSLGVAARLAAHAIPHRVLNARQDSEEASIVAEAGRARQVTVATNMAGRGTDIALGPGVAERGGLHVVSLAFNDARRVDRQLAGRAARQGEPGSSRRVVSLDDPVLRAALSGDGAERIVRCLARLLHGFERARTPAVEEPRVQGKTVSVATEHEGNRSRRLAERCALLVVRLAQRRVERRHARERLAAFEAREPLARHVAIGGQPDSSR